MIAYPVPLANYALHRSWIAGYVAANHVKRSTDVISTKNIEDLLGIGTRAVIKCQTYLAGSSTQLRIGDCPLNNRRAYRHKWNVSSIRLSSITRIFCRCDGATVFRRAR